MARTEIEMRPTSIRIFLADGKPDGLRIVEKSNWTGRAVVAVEVGRALTRPELRQPGVYVLVGADDNGEARLYVGEADTLSDRIKQHVSSKRVLDPADCIHEHERRSEQGACPLP